MTMGVPDAAAAPAGAAVIAGNAASIPKARSSATRWRGPRVVVLDACIDPPGFRTVLTAECTDALPAIQGRSPPFRRLGAPNTQPTYTPRQVETGSPA